MELTRRGSRWIALASGFAFCAVYVGIALIRMRYPFELEWMEGGVVDHVRQVVNGAPVFAPPTLDFVSYLYPPLYYYIAALPAALFGVDFFALRLVSFAASIGSAWMIFRVVARETGEKELGFLSAALFLATFEQSGGWLDIARIDSLFILFLISGIYFAGFAQTRGQLIAAGLLLACATMVKQSALVAVAPLVLCSAWFDFRRTSIWTGVMVGSVALSWVVLDVIHGGWLTYYCFTIPRNHPVEYMQISRFWTHDVAGPLKIACGLSLIYLVVGNFPRRSGNGLRNGSDEQSRSSAGDTETAELRKRRWFYAAMAVGLVGSSWSVRSVVGAWSNNLLPAFVAISVLTGLGIHTLRQRARGTGAEVAAPRAVVVETLIWLAVLLQFAQLAYDPRAHLPTDADRAAGEQAVETLREIEGEVYIPHHGYLALKAGHRSHAHTLAMDNIFLDGKGPHRMSLAKELREALRQRRFAAVVVESDRWRRGQIRKSYRLSSALFPNREVFWPVSGGRIRPESLFIPRDPDRINPE